MDSEELLHVTQTPWKEMKMSYPHHLSVNIHREVIPLYCKFTNVSSSGRMEPARD